MCKLYKQKIIIILLFIITVWSPLSASALNAASPPIKITVKEPGIYSVTYADIKAVGWEPGSIDPTKLQLQSRGKGIPLLFYGEEDHSFDAGDYFVFYGEPWEDTLTHPYYTDNKSSFTIDTIYWLSIAHTAATRIERVTQAPVAGAPFIKDFKHTEHFELDNNFTSEEILRYYWEKFPDDKDATRTDPAAKDINIALHDINVQKERMLRIKFFGGSDIPDTENDHHARIIVNDAVAYDAWLTNFRFYIHSENINSGILKEGENIITIKNIFEPGSENIFCLVWIEVEYSRFLKAADNELFFADNSNSTSPHNIKIEGFQSNAMLLFDITTPQQVKKIEGLTVSGVSGNYSAAFGLQSNAERKFLILSSDKIKKPASILVDEPSELKSPSNQADYIIITHADFYEEIQRLAKHREDEGYRVNVVKVQDVYDEFNYGLMHPQAIKDFLTYTFNGWSSPAPTFVLLVGDGCSDATDRLNRGNKNFIPIKLELFKLRYTANDNWYVQLKGDDILPEMIIGRIPVKTSDQLKNIIDKIITYEKDEKNPWERNVQFIAGKDIYGRNDGELFSSINRNAAKKALPFNYRPYFLTPEDYENNDDPGKTIVYNIDSGRAITVYLGHSSISDWTDLFTVPYFEGLQNYQKPTFLISLDCSNGNFAHPLQEGFAEEFLRIPGGGLACLAPTAIVNISEHQSVISNILSEIFNNKNAVLGSACNQAKITSYLNDQLSKDAFQEFTFLGDPATKLKICEFNLESPADAASVSSNAQFTWVADGYTRFQIQFSPYPDFSRFPTLSFNTTGPSFTPNPLVSARLNLMAKTHGTIYWRVGGLKNTDELTSFFSYVTDLQNPRFTQPWSFTIQ